MPLRPIFLGVADTNVIEPAASELTVTVAVAVDPAIVAVIVSVPEKVLAVYVVVAIPLTVVTGELIVALPKADWVEVNTTLTGEDVNSAPLESLTVTETLVDPPKDNVDSPRVIDR